MNQIIKGNAPVDALNEGKPVDSYEDYDNEGCVSPSDFMKMIDEAVDEEEIDTYDEPEVDEEEDREDLEFAYKKIEEGYYTRPLNVEDVAGISVADLVSRIDEEEELDDQFAYLDQMEDEEEDDEDYAGKEITIGNNDDEDEEGEESPAEEKSIVDFPKITFARKKVFGREIFSVSDGIRNIDIDISTLDEDVSTDALLPDGINNHDTIYMIADAFIDEIINLCYPSAAFAGKQLFEEVKSIEECSDCFKFTTYKNTTAILAYYVPAESKRILLDTLIKYKNTKAGNILFAVRGHMLSDGFNFKKVDTQEFLNYVNEDSHKELQDAFIAVLKSDTLTVFNDGSDVTDFTDTGVVPVQFGLTNEYLSDIINNAVGNETEDDDLFKEAQFATEGSVFDDEPEGEPVVEVTTKVEEKVEVQVVTEEVQEEPKEEESLFSDVEEAEETEITFDVKKPTETEKKQESKKEDSSDDEFIIKRRF